MISTTEDLSSFLNSLPSGTTCAIDTEADSLHRYKESLCLVQFTAGPKCVLIDPLEIEDLSPLATFLDTSKVWMHGADYDMTMLKREFGRIPPTVYDTQIGARLLGVTKFGLGNLVSHYFDITLEKSSQKADWGRRPLSEKMVEYALNDVRYLLEMGEKIITQLSELGRDQWFFESCEQARTKVEQRDDSGTDQWRISGSGKLDSPELAALRLLWNWRDVEAAAWDKPSFMVAPNRQLIEWAPLIAAGKSPRLPRQYRPSRLESFAEMLTKYKDLPEDQYPKRIMKKRRVRDRNFDDRVDALLAIRNEKGAELNIDPSLLASRSVLESIVAKEAAADDLLMSWQQEILAL